MNGLPLVRAWMLRKSWLRLSRAAAGDARRRRSQGRSSHVADRRGAVALEFILVAPFLLLIMFLILYLGIAMTDQLILTVAAEQGAETLALGGGRPSPYSDAFNAIASAAATLDQSNITRAMTIAGTTCNTDSACSALLTTSKGRPASVTLQYPYAFPLMGFNFQWTLQAASAAAVQ